MDLTNISMTGLASISIALNTLIYFLMNGAQIFETLIFVPRWNGTSSNHLYLLDSKIKLADLKYFWICFHSLHEITFILSILLCWYFVEIRNWLLVLFIIHMCIRVWTIVYFAARIIEFQNWNEPTLSKEMAQKMANWTKWNYLRVFIFISISIALVSVTCKVLRIYFES